jgi:hypothetical protein
MQTTMKLKSVAALVLSTGLNSISVFASTNGATFSPSDTSSGVGSMSFVGTTSFAPSDSNSDVGTMSFEHRDVDGATIFDGNSTFSVYYLPFIQAASSISADENGTIFPAYQTYFYNYVVYSDQDAGFNPFNITIHRSGEKDCTTGEDRTECDFFGVDDEQCNSCTYCGNEAFSADCTNVPFGRKIECESSSTLIFPLIAEVMDNSERLTGLDSMGGLTSTTFSPSDTSSGVGSMSFAGTTSFAPSDSNSDAGTMSFEHSGGVDGASIFDGNSTFRVYYRPFIQAASTISVDENGTIFQAYKTYFYNYVIYSDQDGGFNPFNITIYRSGEKDCTTGEDRTECDFFGVDDEQCNSCTYCGNETFSADCTNVPFGRKIECESSSTLLFPLTSEVIEQI